jgi:hypothetical protein
VSYLDNTTTFGGVRRSGATAAEIAMYQPQPGDIILFDSQSTVMKGLYFLAGTQLPDHAAIVVPGPGGRPMLLEAGPIPSLSVTMVDVLGRLRAFTGQIWIRKFTGTLTPQQTTKLAQFAKEQVGKRYSLTRFILQGTPFQARRLLKPFAKTHLDRTAWLCSELVIAACTSINLLGPETVPSTACYPRDIVENERYNFNRYWAGACQWRVSSPMARTPRRAPSGPVARPVPQRPVHA